MTRNWREYEYAWKVSQIFLLCAMRSAMGRRARAAPSHPRALPLLAALCLVAAPAFAHAVVIHATLQDVPPPPDTPTTVTLRFNAAIEASLAKVYLLDASGRLLELQAGPSQAPDQLVVELPSLRPGAYGLKYKVLAADGHFTENGLRFRIREKP